MQHEVICFGNITFQVMQNNTNKNNWLHLIRRGACNLCFLLQLPLLMPDIFSLLISVHKHGVSSSAHQLSCFFGQMFPQLTVHYHYFFLIQTTLVTWMPSVCKYTCFSLPFWWSYCSHSYVKSLHIVTGYAITVVKQQNTFISNIYLGSKHANKSTCYLMHL